MLPGRYLTTPMLRSLATAAAIGLLSTIACLCAVNAAGGDAYSVVAQSDESTAATGRRPLSHRITAATKPNLPARSDLQHPPGIIALHGRPSTVAPAAQRTASLPQRSSGNGLRSSSPSAVTR